MTRVSSLLGTGGAMSETDMPVVAAQGDQAIATCQTGMDDAPGLGRLLGRRFKYLRLEWHARYSMLRARTCVKPVQCYSLTGMSEMQRVLSDISDCPGVVRHLVVTSDVPEVFSFGGDLALLTLLVRAKDRASLKMYARRCIDLIWWLEQAASFGVHTMVLVQGTTLGGGLESVFPFHRVIFERSASGGFPEVLFNLFPAVGAWQFGIRKAGFAVANEMILSGTVYSADELHQRGLVDTVVPDGQGEQTLLEAVHTIDPRLQGVLAALEARRRVAPISLESLVDVMELWIEAALRLSERDLRLMDRLARAQARKVGGTSDGAIEEIKRFELESAWHETQSGTLPHDK